MTLSPLRTYRRADGAPTTTQRIFTLLDDGREVTHREISHDLGVTLGITTGSLQHMLRQDLLVVTRRAKRTSPKGGQPYINVYARSDRWQGDVAA